MEVLDKRSIIYQLFNYCWLSFQGRSELLGFQMRFNKTCVALFTGFNNFTLFMIIQKIRKFLFFNPDFQETFFSFSLKKLY